MRPSIWFLLIVCHSLAHGAPDAGQLFRAGAQAVDITPTNYPVIVNAMFTERAADSAADPLFARALVLDDGTHRIAIVVVDTCMMPRDLIDRAKEKASAAAGIPSNRMLVSATHTHSAPSAMGCLGSRSDPAYVEFLIPRISEAITRATAKLQPARIGWTTLDDWDHTFNRRWIRHPDRLLTDPFGNRNVRAHMHPGHQSPDAIGPSGPVDPGLSVLSVQDKAGRPLALLANYSQHYYGSPLLSSDYFGAFATEIARRLGATHSSPSFVAMMSQGTSGDLMWMDYAAPRRAIGHKAYGQELAGRVFASLADVQYHDWAPLRMAEAELTLRFRTPDARRLEWATNLAATLEGRLPRSQPEIYALEAIHLHQRPTATLKLQAVRIGELGIAAIPNEVYAITGLKIKARSPLQPTFNIELANGGEGYIPPPEQHHLGGYTTWPARTAGLEPAAEPRIVETILSLLQSVSERPPRPLRNPPGRYTRAILKTGPTAYWRLNEIAGAIAHDATGHGNHATYENNIAFYLPGPGSGEGVSPHPQLTPSNFSQVAINRSPHFAGGRLTATLTNLGQNYSVDFWFWSGLSSDTRPVTGFLFSRAGRANLGDLLGITGGADDPGRLFITDDPAKIRLAGTTPIELRRWHHAVFVRSGQNVAVYLDGHTVPEIEGELNSDLPLGTTLLFGGAPDNQAPFEGKLDEAAVFDRALSTSEIALHEQAAGLAEERSRTLARAAERSGARQFDPSFLESVRAMKPLLHWRLEARRGSQAPDLLDQNDGRIEGGVFFEDKRSARFFGGRIRGNPGDLGDRYSVSFWFRNDLANDARPVTAYLFSRGDDGVREAPGDHLGIGGTHQPRLAGKLIVFNGNGSNQLLTGTTVIPPGSWNHVVLVRDGEQVTVYLNQTPEPEIRGALPITYPQGTATLFLGGRNDRFAPLQGYLDEVTLFGRALGGAEALALGR